MFVITRLLMFEVNDKLHMVFKVPNSNSGYVGKINYINSNYHF